jgi:hypothetical protein
MIHKKIVVFATAGFFPEPPGGFCPGKGRKGPGPQGGDPGAPKVEAPAPAAKRGAKPVKVEKKAKKAQPK